MPLHGLADLTFGVPNIADVTEYYVDFGLDVTRTDPDGATHLATVDGGEQLHLRHAARRGLLSLTVAVDDEDDLGRIAASLARLDLEATRSGDSLTTRDPGAGVEVKVAIAPRIVETPADAVAYNGPGRSTRGPERAPGILRQGRVRPRRLGHVVFGSPDQPASQKFFTEGIGFKVSDYTHGAGVGLGAFMRCSTDHHNVMVQQAPGFALHHTSWQVEDIDEIGRGATTMIEKDPRRHAWGLGRHHIGSNFYWYLMDPAGSFSEYYSDMDRIGEDEIWEPGEWEGMPTLKAWGPMPPEYFFHPESNHGYPEDLAALMTGAHAR